MEEKIETGGPAFPVAGMVGRGMTLRDYFAAKAMQGFCSGSFWGEANNDECAVAAYEIADAMLKAREVKMKTNTRKPGVESWSSI